MTSLALARAQKAQQLQVHTPLPLRKRRLIFLGLASQPWFGPEPVTEAWEGVLMGNCNQKVGAVSWVAKTPQKLQSASDLLRKPFFFFALDDVLRTPFVLLITMAAPESPHLSCLISSFCR